MDVLSKCQKDAQGSGFPPSGSYQASSGSAHSFCGGFWRFFDTVDGIIDFSSIGQKDAQGSVPPLWVRMKRVCALRARFTTVFGCSLIFRFSLRGPHGLTSPTYLFVFFNFWVSTSLTDRWTDRPHPFTQNRANFQKIQTTHRRTSVGPGKNGFEVDFGRRV